MLGKRLLIQTFLIFLTLPFCVSSQEKETLFPIPTGVYQVATQKVFLTDSLRKESFKCGKKKREIYAKIWYPVEVEDDIEYENFLNDYPTKVVVGIFKSVGLDRELVGQIKKTYTHSLVGDYLPPSDKKFPVIIFNPGFYFGMSDFYTCLIENLASNGYIVCSVNHPYEQPYVEQKDKKDAKLKKKKAQLAYLQLFLLDKFKKFKLDSPEDVEMATRTYLKKLSRFDKILRRWGEDTEFFISYVEKASVGMYSDTIFTSADIDKIGVLGQSVGGAVAGHLSVKDSRVKAGVNLDCFQFGDMIDEPLEVPFMLMQSEHYFMWNLGNSVVYRNTKSDFYRVGIKKSRHFAFSDASFLDLIGEEEKKSMIGEIDGPATIETINNYILEFYNTYLKGEAPVLLEQEVEDEQIKFEKIPGHAN